MSFLATFVPIQQLNPSLFSLKVSQLDVLREDRIDAFVSGNKFRKLVYNLEEARTQKKKQLLTFGGAFSNHIAAVAAAGKNQNFKSIGIIRGDELASMPRNATLAYAEEHGMHLHFVSRADYKRKGDPDFNEDLNHLFGDFYLIPEGGTNTLAVKGCEEILSERTKGYDFICAPVGTGGTLAGLVRASKAHQKVVGFSALKGTFQKEDVKKYSGKSDFEILDDYCFGGYGKIDVGLVRFINDFKQKTQIPLDPIYTGKMMYGTFDLIRKGYFGESSKILMVHTGGLQGIKGMNNKLLKKNLPQIA